MNFHATGMKRLAPLPQPSRYPFLTSDHTARHKHNRLLVHNCTEGAQAAGIHKQSPENPAHCQHTCGVHSNHLFATGMRKLLTESLRMVWATPGAAPPSLHLMAHPSTDRTKAFVTERAWASLAAVAGADLVQDGADHPRRALPLQERLAPLGDVAVRIAGVRGRRLQGGM